MSDVRNETDSLGVVEFRPTSYGAPRPSARSSISASARI